MAGWLNCSPLGVGRVSLVAVQQSLHSGWRVEAKLLCPLPPLLPSHA